MLMIDTRIDIFTRIKLEDAVNEDTPQKRIDGVMEIINTDDTFKTKDEEIKEYDDEICRLEGQNEDLEDKIFDLEEKIEKLTKQLKEKK